MIETEQQELDRLVIELSARQKPREPERWEIFTCDDCQYALTCYERWVTSLRYWNEFPRKVICSRFRKKENQHVEEKETSRS